jgi:hypothetical protein
MAYFSASGAFLPKDCPKSVYDPPYCDETWTPASVNLTDITLSTDMVSEMKASLFKFNEAKPSASRFINHYHNDYKNVAAHGFNVWEDNKHCQIFDEKQNKTITCNGMSAAGGCKLKFMSLEAS